MGSHKNLKNPFGKLLLTACRWVCPGLLGKWGVKCSLLQPNCNNSLAGQLETVTSGLIRSAIARAIRSMGMFVFLSSQLAGTIGWLYLLGSIAGASGGPSGMSQCVYSQFVPYNSLYLDWCFCVKFCTESFYSPPFYDNSKTSRLLIREYWLRFIIRKGLRPLLSHNINLKLDMIHFIKHS